MTDPMTYLDEFRDDLDQFRNMVADNAIKFKESNGSTIRLTHLYRRFDNGQRLLANVVIGEWLLSSDSGIRFDAESLSCLGFQDRICDPLPLGTCAKAISRADAASTS